MNVSLFRPIHFIMVTLTMITTLSSPTRAESWSTIDLTIENIEAERGGLLHVYLFLKDGFPVDHKKALRSYVKPVNSKVIPFSIQAPSDAPFALKIHHDENGDRKVTKNWTGIFPAEGLGFSSGAKLSFGPPSFKKAKMMMPASKSISITMRYP